MFGLCRYLVSQNGLRACNLDTSTPGNLTVAYSVTNSAGLSAGVNRTITVQIVCAVGEHVCNNKVTRYSMCMLLPALQFCHHMET